MSLPSSLAGRFALLFAAFVLPLLAASEAPKGDVIGALLASRGWIIYTPSRPFNPNAGIYPVAADLLRDLNQLYAEGWRGLVTYSLDNTLAEIPCLARQVGFTKVIAGIFWYDGAQLSRERSGALRNLPCIDGFMLGNEGLSSSPPRKERLLSEIQRLRADSALPVATSETLDIYLNDSSLLLAGDFTFPNIHPWFAKIRPASDAAAWTIAHVNGLRAKLPPGRALVLHESWWPTAGEAGASEIVQSAYYRRLSESGVCFILGEAYRQFWKTAEGAQGPNWGLHTDRGAPKQIITDLASVYTGLYPPLILPGAIVNGASFIAIPLSPGLIAVLFGAALRPVELRQLRLTSYGAVADEIADTKVCVNGVAAPLLYVRRDTLAFVVPYSASAAPVAQIQVQHREANRRRSRCPSRPLRLRCLRSRVRASGPPRSTRIDH